MMRGGLSGAGCHLPSLVMSPGFSMVTVTGREGLTDRIYAISEVRFLFLPSLSLSQSRNEKERSEL